MKDHYGREITYLRISVTDRCNLRCVYCMPEEGIVKQPHCDILSLEEIAEIAREAVGLGIRKIRITGGEPLVRRGILSLFQELASLPNLSELAFTTNGTLLAPMAKEIKAAGVDRVNISLDTLNPDKYRRITRLGRLEDALSGIRAAMNGHLYIPPCGKPMRDKKEICAKGSRCAITAASFFERGGQAQVSGPVKTGKTVCPV